jgi:hypothetical protein
VDGIRTAGPILVFIDGALRLPPPLDFPLCGRGIHELGLITPTSETMKMAW